MNAPQIITSQTGQTIWSAKYDPFGKATVTGNIKYNLRADGQYQDDETGLYYNWYRYYNPELGRYITSDPLGLQAGMNMYIYVNGNPVNFTDPTGLDVNVCLYRGGGGNPFGHTGFGVGTEKDTTGFYNTHGIITGDGAIRSDSDHTKIECQTIKSTTEQDNCMLKCRADREQNLGRYNLFTRQCTSFVQDCLEQCKLPHSPDSWNVLPANFYINLKYELNGAKKYINR